MRCVVTAGFLFACTLAGALANAAGIDWTRVGEALGRPGTVLPGNVYKAGFPRTDLKVTVDGIAIKPALALGSWVAFQPTGSDAMCMGDLALTEREVSPVMKRLIDGGFNITAVHNHLLRALPAVVYMHFSAHGDPVALAHTLHAALALSHTPLAPPRTSLPAPVALDTAALDNALGFKGSANGGVYQFSVPRSDVIFEGSMTIPPSMGTAIAINFQPTGRGEAATTGDFVLLGTEVQPVLQALRGRGIEVTALHSHMIGEEPHLYFVHFWAHGNALDLARGLRAALDRVNVKGIP